jgi:spore germination protein KA
MPGFRKAKSSSPNENQRINSEFFRQILSDNGDIVISEVALNSNKDRICTVIFINGLVNQTLVDLAVLKPLIQEDILEKPRNENDVIDYIMLGTAYHCQRRMREKFNDCLADLFSGSAVLVFDEIQKAVTFDLKGFERRNITEPTNENVIKGSKESFIEVLRVNTSLIRRRIQTSKLKINQMTVGKRTNTTLAIVYMDDVANHLIVQEVKNRLDAIDIDGITTAGEIEAFIIDNKWTFFPQVIYTERSDKFCANILEGRVGILIDGLPIAYILPVDFNAFFQAPEDYALHYIQSSFFRLMRCVNSFASMILPALYVSVTTFHQEMIPTDLAISIIQSKEGVPFPTFIEVVLMLLAFEVLLEAGLRLPKSIGQSVSIIGALVVGDVAITAKMLSPGVVIVIAVSGITGFVIPSQDMANANRICRLLLVFCAITSGLYGTSIGLILLIYHLCTLEVFGVPYLSPFVANEGKQTFNDTIIRFPWAQLKNRPLNIKPTDVKRQG